MLKCIFFSSDLHFNIWKEKKHETLNIEFQFISKRAIKIWDL